MYPIHQVSVGKPQTYMLNGKQLHTGFIKHPVNEGVFLTKTGLKGDGQADLKNHGGKDKALLMYPIEHYQYWEARYLRNFPIPSFGENITIEGITEKDVCIGDTFKLGEAVIQVSQPRNPCYKIAEVNGIKDITAAVTQTGFSGYYFRVMKEGSISAEDPLILLDKDPNQITVSDVQQVLFHQKKNRERIEQVLQLESLADEICNTLEKHLKKL